jgi:hypothetical protein
MSQRTGLPLLRWQTGLKIPVDKMLPIHLASEGLRARPVLCGEVRVCRKKLCSFQLGLVHAAKLCETSGQDSL